MNRIKTQIKLLLLLVISTAASMQAQTTKTADRSETITLTAPDGYNMYQWQVSTDNKLYMDLPSATSINYTFKATAPSFYRIKATKKDDSIEYIDTTKITFPEIEYQGEGRLLPASHGYVEVNGRSSSGINIPAGERIDASPTYNATGETVAPTLNLTNWSNKDAHAVWYAYQHISKFDIKLLIKTQLLKEYKFRLIITDPDDPTHPIADNYISFKGTTSLLELPVASIDIKEGKYYRYDLECLENNQYITSINGWQFDYDQEGHTYTPAYLSSPSVHLGNWKTSNAQAPVGNYYDWCYEEIMIPEYSDIVGTYAMSLGVLKGYMGIQCNPNGNHDVIFSMWDDGSTDEDPGLEDYKRAGAVDASPIVTVSRFGNEGTGVKTFAAGDLWTPGTYVKFITNARPETVTYTIEEDGEEKEITRHNTLVSAWFNAGDEKGWQYLATTRLPGQNHYFSSWYSFLENYNWPSGQMLRRAYYRNGYIHARLRNTWYHCNNVSFSHTDGSSNIGARRDYGQGRDAEDPTAFFMQTGGYLKTVQTENSVVYDRLNTPVKDIDLNKLLERVDLAVQNEEKRLEDAKNVEKTLYDKTDWEVISYSSEETRGEGTNGRASLIIDGDENTYWHSQWLSGTATFPHYFVIDMKNIQPINGIQYVTSGGTSRRMKEVNLYASLNNKDWHKIYETTNSSDLDKFYVSLDSVVTTRYFKIEITKDWNDDVHTRLNEVDVTHPLSYDPTAIREIKTDKRKVLTVYATPNTRCINIVAPETAPEMKINVYNAFGTKLFTQHCYDQKTNEVNTIKLPPLNNNICIIEAQIGQNRYTTSILIK